KANVDITEVSPVTIWGNHSSTQVADFLNARISGKKAIEVIQDRSWFENDFFQKVQKRGAEVIVARGKSSAASAAHAAIEAMRSLVFPTREGDSFSCALLSNGNPYGIQEGIVFSFPCKSRGEGRVEIIKNVVWDDFLKAKIAL